MKKQDICKNCEYFKQSKAFLLGGETAYGICVKKKELVNRNKKKCVYNV